MFYEGTGGRGHGGAGGCAAQLVVIVGGAVIRWCIILEGVRRTKPVSGTLFWFVVVGRMVGDEQA